MTTVQLILIIAGVIIVLAVLFALMSYARRRGEKRVRDQGAAGGDATAQNPDEDPRHP